MGAWARGNKQGTGQDLSSSGGCEPHSLPPSSHRVGFEDIAVEEMTLLDGSLNTFTGVFMEYVMESLPTKQVHGSNSSDAYNSSINRAGTPVAVHCSPLSPPIIWPSLPSGTAVSHHPSLQGVVQERLPLITPS